MELFLQAPVHVRTLIHQTQRLHWPSIALPRANVVQTCFKVFFSPGVLYVELASDQLACAKCAGRTLYVGLWVSQKLQLRAAAMSVELAHGVYLTWIMEE